MPSDYKLKELIYKSKHRGCKENDILLGEFADIHLQKLTHDQINIYSNLINESDEKIYAWISGKEKIPDIYKEIISILINLRFGK